MCTYLNFWNQPININNLINFYDLLWHVIIEILENLQTDTDYNVALLIKNCDYSKITLLSGYCYSEDCTYKMHVITWLRYI